MPTLWEETIDAHRRAVGDAILDITAGLVAEHGLRSVTMSEIAERAGIGRATLYKYFPDVEAILTAWHERQIEAHLRELAELGAGRGGPGDRLAAVLERYASIRHEHHDEDVGMLLHGGPHVARTEHRLQDFLEGLLTEAAEAGEVRDDVGPGELATFCVHALAAARALPSKAAVRRLVSVTAAGLAARGERP